MPSKADSKKVIKIFSEEKGIKYLLLWGRKVKRQRERKEIE